MTDRKDQKNREFNINYAGTVTGRVSMAAPNMEEVERFNQQEDAYIEALIAEYEVGALPEWTIGHAHGQYVLGAQLPTRDGRRMGNAHIVEIKEGCLGTGQQVYTLLTDAGTKVVMTANELNECFYPPQYVSDVKEVLTKFGTTSGQHLRPGLEWAIAHCKALQEQGFPRAWNSVLIKNFQNCLGDAHD